MNSLTVVGTGIRLGQMTVEAQQAVRRVDIVLAAVADQPALEMLRMLNPAVEDLATEYKEGRERLEIYRAMANRVMAELRAGKNVCFALYGHPLVFAYPPSLALEMARAEGFPTKVLPGVSSEDLIFADLRIDPAEFGCQSYSASSMVKERRIWDPRALLVLWQVGVIGESRYLSESSTPMLQALADTLLAVYGGSHPVVCYECSTLPFFPPEARLVPMAQLASLVVRPTCTLIVPPIHRPDYIHPDLTSQDGASWLDLNS